MNPLSTPFKPTLFRLLAVSILVAIGGCASKGPKVVEVVDPVLTGTWKGNMRCEGQDVPVTLTIGGFSNIRATGQIEFKTPAGKDWSQQVDFYKNKIENPYRAWLNSKDYDKKWKKKRNRGDLFRITAGTLNNSRSNIKFKRVSGISGCESLTLVYQRPNVRSTIAVAERVNAYLPTGSWKGNTKCSGRKTQLEMHVGPSSNTGQEIKVAAHGYKTNFNIRPTSIDEKGMVHYQVDSQDGNAPRSIERPSDSSFYEISMPLARNCGEVTFGIFEPVEGAGGSYKQAFDGPGGFCDTFGYWIEGNTFKRDMTRDILEREFGSELGSRLRRKSSIEQLFSGSNKNLVYGALPVGNEKSVLSKIDRQLAACFDYISYKADSLRPVYRKYIFVDARTRKDAESRGRSNLSRLYLAGRDTLNPGSISVPAEWKRSIDNPREIEALAKSDIDWVDSQDIVDVGNALVPYRKAIKQAKTSRVNAADEERRRKRKSEKPLESALIRHMLEDCTRIGVLVGSEGRAMVGSAAPKGRLCETSTLGTKVSTGINRARDFQCHPAGGSEKACTFVIDVACLISSEFGTKQSNNMIESAICGPIRAVPAIGKAMFRQIGPDEWKALEVNYGK